MWYGFKTSYIDYFCILNKLTIDEMCLKYNLDKNIIKKFLTDDETISIKELLEISKLLNIELNQLFYEGTVPSKTLNFN